MRKISAIFSAVLAVTLAPVPTASSAATEDTINDGVLIRKGTQPCKVVATDSAKIDEQVRRLKRQGYLVTVKRSGEPDKIQTPRGTPFPPELNRARTTASGC